MPADNSKLQYATTCCNASAPACAGPSAKFSVDTHQQFRPPVDMMSHLWGTQRHIDRSFLEPIPKHIIKVNKLYEEGWTHHQIRHNNCVQQRCVVRVGQGGHENNVCPVILSHGLDMSCMPAHDKVCQQARKRTNAEHVAGHTWTHLRVSP